MKDVTNVSPKKRKTKSPNTKHVKENKDDGEVRNID
jgi:hypothetical protein